MAFLSTQRLFLSLFAASLLVQLLMVEDALRYERTAIFAGEAWRLLTGHLAHLGWGHWGLNALGLVLTYFLVGGRFDSAAWAVVVVGSALAIGAGLLAFNPELLWYVGLSGVLHGMLAAGALKGASERHLDSSLLLLLLVAKLSWEQWAGPLPGSEASAGGRVIVDAHLYGAVGGLGFGGVIITLQRLKTGRRRP